MRPSDEWEASIWNFKEWFRRDGLYRAEKGKSYTMSRHDNQQAIVAGLQKEIIN